MEAIANLNQKIKHWHGSYDFKGRQDSAPPNKICMLR